MRLMLKAIKRLRWAVSAAALRVRHELTIFPEGREYASLSGQLRSCIDRIDLLLKSPAVQWRQKFEWPHPSLNGAHEMVGGKIYYAELGTYKYFVGAHGPLKHPSYHFGYVDSNNTPHLSSDNSLVAQQIFRRLERHFDPRRNALHSGAWS